MQVSPNIAEAKAYLGSDHSWSDTQVEAALNAEAAAQARVVRIPDGVGYPPDLAEALFRRVAANLALRALPLGLQSSASEMAITTTRVGGGDAEVRRLERPYRRLAVG